MQALARALYNGSRTFVFDDIFSALDVHTEQQVFSNLFGSSGWLTDKTVILTTNDTSRVHLADHIIHLSDGQLLQQGSPKNLSVDKRQRSAGDARSTSKEDKEAFDQAEDDEQTKKDGDDVDEALYMRGELFSSKITHLDAGLRY